MASRWQRVQHSQKGAQLSVVSEITQPFGQDYSPLIRNHRSSTLLALAHFHLEFICTFMLVRRRCPFPAQPKTKQKCLSTCDCDLIAWMHCLPQGSWRQVRSLASMELETQKQENKMLCKCKQFCSLAQKQIIHNLNAFMTNRKFSRQTEAKFPGLSYTKGIDLQLKHIRYSTEMDWYLQDLSQKMSGSKSMSLLLELETQFHSRKLQPTHKIK